MDIRIKRFTNIGFTSGLIFNYSVSVEGNLK